MSFNFKENRRFIMKKKIYILASVLLLIACGKQSSSNSGLSNSSSTSGDTLNPNSSNSSHTSGLSWSNTSSSNSSSSNSSSNSSNSNSSSSGEILDTQTITEIRTLANQITNVDANGSGLGQNVKFEAKYLAELTDNMEKLMLVSDGLSTINVRVNNTSTGRSVGTYYIFTGTVALYYGRPEVKLVSTATSTKSGDLDLSSIAPLKTIAEAYEIINTFKLNGKGNAYDELITLEVQKIAKAENSLMLVYDGINVLYIHGDDRINNSHTDGNVYRFIVSLSMLLYKPGSEFISSTFLRTEPIVYGASTPTNVAEILATSRENEKFKYFPKLLSFKGYVNAWIKDYSRYYFAFVDKDGDRVQWQSNALPSKALYIHNHANLDSRDLNYSVFTPYFDDKIQVECLFVMYMYNTSYHTWQVHALDNSVAVL